MLGKKYCKIFINIIILTFLNFRALVLYYFWYLPLSESHLQRKYGSLVGCFWGISRKVKYWRLWKLWIVDIGAPIFFFAYRMVLIIITQCFSPPPPSFSFLCQMLKFEGSLGKFVWGLEFTYLCKKLNVYGKYFGVVNSRLREWMTN